MSDTEEWLTDATWEARFGDCSSNYIPPLRLLAHIYCEGRKPLVFSEVGQNIFVMLLDEEVVYAVFSGAVMIQCSFDGTAIRDAARRTLTKVHREIWFDLLRVSSLTAYGGAAARFTEGLDQIRDELHDALHDEDDRPYLRLLGYLDR
jgi:hypothetical protein